MIRKRKPWTFFCVVCHHESAHDTEEAAKIAEAIHVRDCNRGSVATYTAKPGDYVVC